MTTESRMIDVMPVSEVIAAMKQVVPAHKTEIESHELSMLRVLTDELIAAKPDAMYEYARFLSIGDRGLDLPKAMLRNRLGGSVILVTGGTGCVGSALMAQLVKFHPARLVSISRGITTSWPAQANAEYMIGDVRDRERMDEIIAKVRPDVIFHVVAQRSPALAEVEVHRTVTTNLFGARNVIDAAIMAHVPQVVLASTGKALRPYSPEIYTASKRAAEWQAQDACAELRISAARFTHVIDNSIVHNKLLHDDVIRLHSPEIVFYVQSALESAQLLLLAYLGAKLDEFRVYAITDLGWPVSLLDVAIGTVALRAQKVPIYISGYDPGYEEVSFPGLYDQETAGDISPLFNAFEAAADIGTPFPMVDVFDLKMAGHIAPNYRLAALEDVCNHTKSPKLIRSMLDHLSWSLLDDTLAAVPQPVLKRTISILDKHPIVLNPVHERITKTIRNYAGE
jgi:FlaA1/EpsC-like NDP-sugar epimerase